MFKRMRNIRRRWFAVAGVVALLSVGLVTGSVVAAGAGGGADGGPFHRGDGTPDNRGGHGDPDALMARVAEILGVEPSDLEAAFVTAMDEQSEIIFDAYIDGLIIDGVLTGDQGNEARTWFQSRPEGAGAMGLHFSDGADSDSDADAIDLWLSMLVETGQLTQEEAAGIRAWFDDRPAFLVNADGGPIGDGLGHERCHDDDGGSASISNDDLEG